MEMEIVDGAEPQDTRAGDADAIHERAAGGAEIVGHHPARGGGVRLAVSGQVLAAADVREVRVEDGEVGGKHRCADLVAVTAVAQKGAEEARALGGECELYGAAIAGCCCRVFFGPAVSGAAG